MVILIFDNQLVNVCITGPPIGDPLKMQWLQGTHTAHQMQLGSHEGAPPLQQKFEAAQTNQVTVDTTGIPPYLKRKQTHHDDRTTVPDGGDWMHSDHRGDKDETRPLGVGRIGEYPPRIRWLRKRHLGSGATKTSSSSLPPPPHNRCNNGSKRRRCSDSAIRRAEGLIARLPENTDGAGVFVSCCDPEMAAPPLKGHLSEASVFDGPRRSLRIREKLIGSACGTRTYQ